jgi:hypothetical protein
MSYAFNTTISEGSARSGVGNYARTSGFIYGSESLKGFHRISTSNHGKSKINEGGESFLNNRASVFNTSLNTSVQSTTGLMTQRFGFASFCNKPKLAPMNKSPVNFRRGP